MHVARPVAMPLQQLEQLADWPIVRNRVWHRHDRLEPKEAFLVTVHHRSLIWLLPPLILHVVFALAVRLPDVYLDAGYRLAICAFHCADNETWLAIRIVCDLGTVGFRDRIVGVEWSKDSAFGASWRLWVIDAVYQEG